MVNRCWHILLFSLFASCTYTRVPHYLKEQFKYSPAEHVNKDTIIQTNGFYRDVVLFNKETISIPCGSFVLTDKDTSIKKNMAVLDIMFFTNGLCRRGHLSNLNTQLDSIENLRIKTEILRHKKSGRVSSLIAGEWGLYTTRNDTLKIKVIGRGSLMASSVWAYEKYYRILNHNTLEPLYCIGLSNGICPELTNCRFRLDSTFYSNSRFYPLEDLYVEPDYSWLMNKKWFWKNKNEYKAWKRNKRP